MKKLSLIVSYILTSLFYLAFGFFLLLFDVIQRVCFYLFGYKAHKVSVDIFNGIAVLSMRIVGTRFNINDNCELPKDAPVLIVSNHQSMWDISPISWYLRRLHPKFISKKELGRGVPTISFNLKKGGSVLIDRKDREQSHKALIDFADYLNKTKRAGVIFPEGSRSRTGELKDFKVGGLKTLIEYLKGAYIVPVSISNSWKLQRNGLFPVPLNVHFKMTVHPAIQINLQSVDELIHSLESIIHKEVVRLNS